MGSKTLLLPIPPPLLWVIGHSGGTSPFLGDGMGRIRRGRNRSFVPWKENGRLPGLHGTYERTYTYEGGGGASHNAGNESENLPLGLGLGAVTYKENLGGGGGGWGAPLLPSIRCARETQFGPRGGGGEEEEIIFGNSIAAAVSPAATETVF